MHPVWVLRQNAKVIEHSFRGTQNCLFVVAAAVLFLYCNFFRSSQNLQDSQFWQLKHWATGRKLLAYIMRSWNFGANMKIRLCQFSKVFGSALYQESTGSSFIGLASLQLNVWPIYRHRHSLSDHVNRQPKTLLPSNQRVVAQIGPWPYNHEIFTVHLSSSSWVHDRVQV